MSNPFVTPWTVAQPGFSVHGISQAKILAWVANFSSSASSHPGIQPKAPAVLFPELQTYSLLLRHIINLQINEYGKLLKVPTSTTSVVTP